MPRSLQNIAKIGEKLAVEHLKTQGYQILAENYRFQRGEIDIIAKHEERIVFVEVKTRRSLKYGLPQSAVNEQKQRQISKIALAYLQEHNLIDTSCRFDVIAIQLTRNLELLHLKQIKSAFEFNYP